MSPASIRVVPELRAVHVDRHRAGTPAELLHLDENYDLAGTDLAPGIRRTTLVGALLRFLRTDATVLEVPEPLWMRFWPRHVALAVGFRVAGAVRGVRRTVCTYAMENNDIATLVGGQRRLPRPVVCGVAWLIGAVARGTIDRICFASPAARDAYLRLPFVAGIPSRVELELPAAAVASDADADAGRVVFVGALEGRKGIRELMAAWELVECAAPDAVLDVVGPGPLEPEVRAWAAVSPATRRVHGRLPHAAARRLVAGATVLAAPSVPDGRWREQIGLPVKEALAAGLTVVTTAQTGLADWLRATGHRVIDVADRASLSRRLGLALVRAIEEPLDRAAVRASLPEREGRLVADAWLHRGAAVGADAVSRDVVVVNTLGGALAHYTRALADSLVDAGGRVSVESIDEPSVSGRGAVRWVRDYVRALRSARATARRSGARVVVTWPVLGHLDRLLCRVVLGRGVRADIVMHDPRPLVRARGYSRTARRIGAVAGGVGYVVHSRTATDALVAHCPGTVPALLPHPVSPQSVSSRTASTHAVSSSPGPAPSGGGGRPVVRVLGQYKPDRDVALLRELGTRLSVTHELQVIGRGWPPIDGWDVEDAFVSEERLDALMATADAVLVPYTRFFQSGIAIRSIEVGTPAIGPAGSSIADLYPDDRFLAAEGDADDWSRAIDDAVGSDRGSMSDLAARADARCRDAWSRWVRGEHVPEPTPVR